MNGYSWGSVGSMDDEISEPSGSPQVPVSRKARKRTNFMLSLQLIPNTTDKGKTRLQADSQTVPDFHLLAHPA